MEQTENNQRRGIGGERKGREKEHLRMSHDMDNSVGIYRGNGGWNGRRG